jgi:2-octaprenylphenol hydroxylase
MTVVNTDIVIVGGGVVGLSLAVALGRSNISVALVEAHKPETDWPQDSIDMRVYAITRASERFFKQLGIWDAIQHSGVSPFRDIHVWDATGSGEIHFDAAELGQPWLGHIIEARVIVKTLVEMLASLSSVQLFCPNAVQGIDELDGKQIVELDNGIKLTGNLLVGADGMNSRVRDYANIHAQVSSYGQQALVAVIETEKSHQETAWQRFLPTGPLAFLPLRDGQSSIVWSATSQVAENLMALDQQQFCASLAEAFDHRLGDIISSSERVLFPLHRQHASHYVKPGIALAGDAAHVIHPLAGQGVNLGLSDVQELTAVLCQAIECERNPGSYAVLRRYERARKGDNLAMMTAMDGFKNLFGSTVPPVKWARNFGLNLIDTATPIKNSIARYAMGL